MSMKSRVWSREKRVDDIIFGAVFAVLFGLAVYGVFTVFDIVTSINT